ncbi:hypothetical protein [Desulfitibacter alkalitolerans]|uniref:hypothetical protein n=1 Tax=Desulfitibacter alkalitolerans TaxID=264641 RepID=UPI0004899B27|nr:hypothetical protein [Desulfitibacter alkalitolerans]
MRRNFRFNNTEYETNSRKNAAPKTSKDKKVKEGELEQEIVEQNVETNLDEEKVIEHSEDKYIDHSEEYSKGLEIWQNETFSSLPAKLPGPLAFIDEDVLLLIILFILLQSPIKDFSLLLIIFLLILNK